MLLKRNINFLDGNPIRLPSGPGEGLKRDGKECRRWDKFSPDFGHQSLALVERANISGGGMTRS